MCARGCVHVYIICFSGVGYTGDQCQGRFIGFNAAAAGAGRAEDTGLRADGSCQESTSTAEPLWLRAAVREEINTFSQSHTVSIRSSQSNASSTSLPQSLVGKKSLEKHKHAPAL